MLYFLGVSNFDLINFITSVVEFNYVLCYTNFENILTMIQLLITRKKKNTKNIKNAD